MDMFMMGAGIMGKGTEQGEKFIRKELSILVNGKTTIIMASESGQIQEQNNSKDCFLMEREKDFVKLPNITKSQSMVFGKTKN